MIKETGSIAYWKEKLFQLRNSLQTLEEDTAEGRAPVELDQSKVGRLSRMDAIQGQAMNNAIAERRRQLLQRIENALIRIEDDEFGYCLKCGEEINSQRLEIDPTVVTCSACSN